MAVVSKTALKNYFLSGKVPVQSNYEDLIDSLFGGAEYIELKDIALPATPGSGYGRISVNNDVLLFKDDQGIYSSLSITKKFIRAPQDPYLKDFRRFAQNDFVNHKAEFNDSQGSPYSFGGSPGGFSIGSVTGGSSAQSNLYRHCLTMYQGGSATPLYIQWTNATGSGEFYLIGAMRNYFNSVDAHIGSIRWWGVQNPGASDYYWEMRFKGTTNGTKYAMAYGQGITFSLTDGTIVGGYWVDFDISQAFNLYRFGAAAGPTGYCDIFDLESHVLHKQLVASVASYPTTIKTIRVHLAASTWSLLQVDSFFTGIEAEGFA